VHADVYDAFAELFVNAMSAQVVGDPMDEATNIGPIALESGRTDLEALVADARAKGATVRCGGERVDGPGWFYPPTVVADITPEMRLFGEEAFGPVAGLFKVNRIDEAIDLANATEFGLGSNAWTNDEKEQQQFIRGINAGAVFINGMTT